MFFRPPRNRKKKGIHSDLQHRGQSRIFPEGRRRDEKTVSFDFELQMTYELDGQKLKITHTVINHDSIPMPFCVGGHPAFNCPISEGEDFEDYVVEFEYPETADCALLNEDALIDNGNRVPILKDSSTLPVKHEMFSQ